VTQLSNALGSASTSILDITGTGTIVRVATPAVTIDGDSVQAVEVSFDLTGSSITVDIDVRNVGVLGDIQGQFTANTAGAITAAAAVGPATIDIGGADLHPFLRILSSGQVDIGLADNGDARFGLAPTIAGDGTTNALWWRFSPTSCSGMSSTSTPSRACSTRH